MNLRFHSGKVLAKQRIFETFISPTYYIGLTVALLLGYFLVSGFQYSIDSSGFNPALNSLYDLIVRVTSGAFGDVFITKLFAQGPFIFALHISFTPVIIILIINTISKFGFEKKSGALELLSYCPADGTSSFTGFFVKDLFFSLISLLILILYFLLLASLNNMVLGSDFFFSAIILFSLSGGIFAYGILSSVITSNNGSSLALFTGILIFFAFAQIGSFTIITGYIKTLSSAFSWLIKWFSPVYYWSMGVKAVDFQIGLFFVFLLLLWILTSAILVISHFLMKHRGIKK